MEFIIYNDQYKHLIEQYQLTEEQLRYTGKPKDCIELSNEDKDRYSILAIEKEKLVTFFVLHKNNGVLPYTDNPHSILIRAFSTDFRYQGKGHAKQALLMLREFIKRNFTDLNEVILAVNVENIAAQGLYKKCGFIDNGIRRMGPKGELIIMSYKL